MLKLTSVFTVAGILLIGSLELPDEENPRHDTAKPPCSPASR